MDGMPMPSGGTMSMMWMRMPGQSWAGTAASFLAMWVAMMVAMMLPSLLPTLWRHRTAMRHAGAVHAERLTALVGVGYFAVWAAFGMIVFPFGVALAAIVMREPALARGAPIAVGAVVMLAGVLQHTTWKSQQLALCRESPSRAHMLPADVRAAWRHGVCLGLHCCGSCAPLTAVLLAVGMMDLRVMTAITAAITAERLAPGGVRVVRAIGHAVVVAGLVLMARAVGLG
jgi:predicted metal-binding membrane protein